jgi:predicted DsbA family dithiol-disulfide isomerase
MRRMAKVTITCFTDILCIWAYIAQLRVDEARSRFGGDVVFDNRFCPVFGDAAGKIATQWAARGGYDGFNAHLTEAAARFPEIRVNRSIWRTVRPASSGGAHVLLKAVQLAEGDGHLAPGAAELAITEMRRAFFVEAQDIGQRNVQMEALRLAGIDADLVETRVHDGSAFAALARDYQDSRTMGVVGSPTFVLNDGRQKLYGNVGYRIIEANIQELLREPDPNQASWC